MTDVVIVPPPGLGSVYGDNRLWAEQFRAADPSTRAVVAMRSSSAASALTATAAAISQAGERGRLIYAVGHGGAGDAPEAGQFDLAPRQQFRVSQFVVYDDDRTHTWRGRPVSEIEREHHAAAAVHRPSARRRARTAWCDRYVEAHCDLAWHQVDQLATLRPHYTEWCRLLRESPLSMVFLLTCNVANAEDFLDEVSTDAGVRMRGYTERVMSRWEESGGERHVWMYLEGDPIGSGTNNDRSDTELLPGVRSDQQITGRVIRTVTDETATDEDAGESPAVIVDD